MSSITTREATIKTCSIEVKVMRISARQVTMSVFRQLPCETVIDPDSGLLAGEVWGRVNYYWGDCTDNHLHVVWLREGQLLRSCVGAKPPDPWWNDGRHPSWAPSWTQIDELNHDLEYLYASWRRKSREAKSDFWTPHGYCYH